MTKQVLLYLPVVHAGHEAFFARHPDAAEVLLLGGGFRDVFKSLAKDIRALPPERAAQFLRLLLPGTPVRVIEPGDLPGAVTADVLVLPDEDVTRNLAAVHQLRDGRMAEHWDVVDVYSMLIQLGALPAPSGAPA